MWHGCKPGIGNSDMQIEDSVCSILLQVIEAAYRSVICVLQDGYGLRLQGESK